MRVCAERSCPRLTQDTRCDQHAKAKRRESDRRRPSARERGYDARWRKTRAEFLRLYPVCQWPGGCLAPAVDVHHRDGLGPSGPRGHDFENLAGMCHAHHSRTTATEQPGGWAQ